MVRGLAAPLLYMAALTSSVALYHTLAEVCWLPAWQSPACLPACLPFHVYLGMGS